MYEMYMSLMRAADAELSAPRHTPTTQRGRGRLARRVRPARHGTAAESRPAMRPACAGLDATAR
jgi:hypothetical protein